MSSPPLDEHPLLRPSPRSVVLESEISDLDASDALRSFRDKFVLPESTIYLDGNSLGPLPRATAGRVASVIEREWGLSLIKSWNAHNWIDMPLTLGAKIGRLIGAEESDVAVCDSTSINLFKVQISIRNE